MPTLDASRSPALQRFVALGTLDGRISAPVTRLTSVMESNGKSMAAWAFRDGFFVRPGHETEGLAFMEVHVRSVPENIELVRGLLECIELGEELPFRELLGREAALALVVGIDEILHRRSPLFVHRVYATSWQETV
jgi:hypothetical protein